MKPYTAETNPGRVKALDDIHHKTADGGARAMIDEPKHPTYGTLDELLADIAKDIRAGYCIRMGQQGALHWFENEYGERRAMPRWPTDLKG